MRFVVAIGAEDGSMERSRLRRAVGAFPVPGWDTEAFRSGPGFGIAVRGPSGPLEEGTAGLVEDAGLLFAGECRLDDADGVWRALGGPQAQRPADAALVLAAYRRFGARCMEHLMGDFAFVIVDPVSRSFFAARDHFGVKPLHYAETGGVLVWSNSVDALRACPGVSSELDERVIGDLLLFGRLHDKESTVFSAIRTLHPGALAEGRATNWRRRRYWSLDEEPGTPVRSGDVVDAVREVLENAVSDRLTGRRASVHLSGGIDSPFIAATALRVRPRGALDLLAITGTWSGIPNFDEPMWARRAAEYLGLQQVLVDQSAPGIFGGHAHPGFHVPQPLSLTGMIGVRHTIQRASDHSDVLLTGYDGDGLHKFSPRAYLRLKLNQSGPLTAAVGYAQYLLASRHVPHRPKWLRGRKQQAARRLRPAPLPAWIRRDFAARFELDERWRSQRLAASAARSSEDPRAALRVQLQNASVAWVLTTHDPAFSGLPSHGRHPMLDLRMVRTMLGVPPIPWCVRKRAFRLAAADRLPADLLNRPKTPLSEVPFLAAPRTPAESFQLHAGSPILRYVDPARISLDSVSGYSLVSAVLQVYHVNWWLETSC
jgi:asparagine synthase (glutamine-hydrolysing)